MKINDVKIVLASGSPRRIEMLQKDGADPVIIKPGCEENLNTELTPQQAVMSLALRKNLWVLDSMPEDLRAEDCLVLSADTVVVYDGKIIGKPEDEEDAFRILSMLRGKEHYVCSGACITRTSIDTKYVFAESTTVKFKDYSDGEIRSYIATGEPMDKAGAYAIQGGFAPYIEYTEGNMDNVIGFPYKTIKEIISKW